MLEGRYFKFLDCDGRGPWSHWQWPLPATPTLGEWTPYLPGDIVRCLYGYHCTDSEHLFQFGAERLFEVEGREAPFYAGDGEYIFRQARLLREYILTPAEAQILCAQVMTHAMQYLAGYHVIVTPQHVDFIARCVQALTTEPLGAAIFRELREGIGDLPTFPTASPIRMGQSSIHTMRRELATALADMLRLFATATTFPQSQERQTLPLGIVTNVQWILLDIISMQRNSLLADSYQFACSNILVECLFGSK